MKTTPCRTSSTSRTEVTTFFFEMRENQAPAPDEPERAWETRGAFRPGRDVDGFFTSNKGDTVAEFPRSGARSSYLPSRRSRAARPIWQELSAGLAAGRRTGSTRRSRR